MSKANIWPNTCIFRLGLALALSLILLIGLLLPIGITRLPGVALAQGSTIRYVATTGSNSGNDCTSSSTPCATVQHAVDVADSGDEILVATGIYTGVQARPRNDVVSTGVVTQVVYISKTVMIRGGYTTANWEVSDPETNPTVLDAQSQGRVLYITGKFSPTIEGLQISNGRADNGGGVFVMTATTTFSNNTISNNFANRFSWGGGLIFVHTPKSTLVNNTISDNQAPDGFGQGGGVSFANSTNMTLIGNTIRENKINVGWGGGLSFSNSSTATLVSNSIINNTSVGGPCGPNCSHGGGLYCVSSSNLTLSNNVITDNLATQAGGGSWFNGCNNIKLVANDISDNNAAAGGGLLATGSADVKLTNNLISGNYAAGVGVTAGGGGLQVTGSTDVELTNNLFSRNGANREGGGASFVNSDNVTLTDNIVTDHDLGNFIIYGAGLHFLNTTNAMLISNTITNNGPVTFGGGLYLANTDALLINNVIADNQVRSTVTPDPISNGSGLYISSSSPRLLHTTIARNSGGDGSGVHITGTLSTVAMTNTILVSQSVGITATAGNTATLNGVLWNGNTTNYGGDGTVIVTNEYTGDPAFAADGYHLMPVSAALDRGVNAGVNDDIDGDPRPMGHGYDLGADELQVALLITKQADPDPVQAGKQLVYTIHLTNTGDVDLHATITDTLPDQVTPNEPLTWTPTITAPGGVWIQPVTVTVQMGYSGTLTNVVQITTEEGATGVYTDTTMAFIVPLQSVTITGPITGMIQGSYTFTATTSPNNASLPITYTWLPTPDNEQVTSTVTYTWTDPGLKTITVTATNPGGTVTDTHIITLTEPPAVSVAKTASPNPVQAGEKLTYTIRLTNTGGVDLHATITDILPTQVTPNETLVWTPTITAPGGGWTTQVIVTVETDYIGLLTNAVQITTQEGANGTAGATVCVGSCLYLPVIMKNLP